MLNDEEKAAVAAAIEGAAGARTVLVLRIDAASSPASLVLSAGRSPDWRAVATWAILQAIEERGGTVPAPLRQGAAAMLASLLSRWCGGEP